MPPSNPDELTVVGESPQPVESEVSYSIDALTARSELKSLATLGAPIVLTQLSQMGMSIVDLVFTGWVSPADQAGVGLGSSLFWPVMLLSTGMLFALTPTIAQLYGQGRYAETGAVARQGGWIACFGLLLVATILINAEHIYNIFEVDPRAVPIAVGYLHAQVWGLVGLFGYMVLRNLCEGLALTTPAMAIALTCLVLKVPLNYVFVFGALGFEGQGGIGCGVSTAIIFWLQLVLIVIAVLRTRIRASGVFTQFDWPDFREIERLVRLGVPIGLSIFAEVAFFSGTVLLVGRYSVEIVAAHNIATSFGGVAFMVPLAIGMASTIRIGAGIGAGRPDAAWLTLKVAIRTALAFGCCMALLIVAFSSNLASLYTNEVEVIAIASGLLIFCAFFQMFDCTQVVMMGCLRGYKDTTYPMYIAVAAYWGVGMPIGLTLGYGWTPFLEPLGVSGFWWGLCSGLSTAAVGLALRARYTAKKFLLKSK